jgi:SSS family solute:Na+ symporter
VLLLAGGLLVFGVSLSHVPGGWEGLMDRMAQDRLDHLVRPVSDAVIPWPGLLLLALSTNVWYCCTNQFYVQSCLGAKNEWHGRMGILLTAFLGPVLTLCCAFPGYIARDLLKLGLIPPIPDDNANNTYPHLARVMLGNGALQGFLVAAVVGAVMSSISAIVNATASMVTLDVYKRWVRPDANDRRLVQVGRWAGAATLAVAYPICLYVMDRRYIFTYSQNAWCILSIPIMWVFAMGMLWKRATTAAANATFLACLPFLAVPFVWGNEIDSWVDAPWLAGLSGVLVPASWYVEGKLHLFNVAFVLWVAAAVFMAAASLLTKAPDPAAVAPYVWNRSLLKPPAGETPAVWWKSVGFWSVVAAGMYAAVYVAYW